MRGLQRRTAVLAVTALVGSVLAVAAVVAAAPAQAAAPNFALFGGYADTFVGTPADHPRPWQNEPVRGRKVLFVGCNAYARFGKKPCRERQDGKGLVYDGGALMLENNSAQHEIVTDVSVTIEGCTFDPWPGLFEDVPADTDLILTQTSVERPPCGTAGRENFDSSDTVPPDHNPCVNDEIAPIVHLSVDFIPEIFADSHQTLNTHGKDLGWGGCRPGPHPENLGWQPLSATVPPCHVVNNRTHHDYNNLQAAVDSATSGDHLTVTGYCRGTTFILDKPLVITGHDELFQGHIFKATLDGSRRGRTLAVLGGSITLDNLIITGARASGAFAGGLFNGFDTMTLTDVNVTANEAGWGAGIENYFGELVMNGGSTITTNIAEHHGGGIYNDRGMLHGATCSNVHNNIPDDIYNAATGTVVCP